MPWIIYKWIGNSTRHKVRNKALDDDFSDKRALSGLHFSFTLQGDFRNLYVFIEIYNVLFGQQAPQALCRIDESTLFTLPLQST